MADGHVWGRIFRTATKPLPSAARPHLPNLSANTNVRSY